MTALSRRTAPLGAALPLLGVSLAVSIGLKIADVPVMDHSSIPAMVAIAAALTALRIVWSRPSTSGPQAMVFFWANLSLAAVAIVMSPVFGLYMFISYYETAQLPGHAQQIAGLVGTAAVISIGQLGGIRSPIFTPLFYGLFVLVNLGIAALMMFLDRTRAALTEEVAAANAELRAEQERTESLRDRLLAQARDAGIQEERSRLSREIHDTVAQDLVAIIAQLDAARDADGEDERVRRLAVVELAARDALAEARRAVHALASPRLDDADLSRALRDYLRQWGAAAGVARTLRIDGVASIGAHDDDLFRVAQESLANVARHSHATSVQVTLAFGADTVVLTVQDDGEGFDAETTPHGHGLTGMRERLARIGGSMVLMSEPGSGTTVVARVPLRGVGPAGGGGADGGVGPAGGAGDTGGGGLVDGVGGSGSAGAADGAESDGGMDGERE